MRRVCLSQLIRPRIGTAAPIGAAAYFFSGLSNLITRPLHTKLFDPTVKGIFLQASPACRLNTRDLTGPPAFTNGLKLFTVDLYRLPAPVLPLFLSECDSLLLTLQDARPLQFRHSAENSQHKAALWRRSVDALF